MKYAGIFLLFAFSFNACISTSNPNYEAEQDSIRTFDAQKAELMHLHDTVMALLPAMDKMQAELEFWADSLAIAPEDSVIAMQSAKSIEGARKAMMDWMGQYSNPKTAEMGFNGAIQYLELQKELMGEVAEQTYSAIAVGDSLLKSVKQK